MSVFREVSVARHASGARRSMVWIAIGVFAACLLYSAGSSSLAQPDGHAGHHPAATEAPQASGNVDRPSGPRMQPAAPGTGGRDAMGDMAESEMMMGKAPSKEFYPSLLDLPQLSTDKRAALEAQAQSWISQGTNGLALAEETLRHANASNDSIGRKLAIARLQDSLAQVRSGASILQSLADGNAPHEIAMTWFRDQLGLPSERQSGIVGGVFGLSWFHLTTMFFVGAVSIVIVATHFARLHRANALAMRLSNVAPLPASSTGSGDGSPQTVLSAPFFRGEGAPEPSHSSDRPRAQTETKKNVSDAPRQGLWKGQLQVVAIFRETPNVKTFRLREPGGGPMPFSFLPGQFLTYSADIDGRLVRRSYTIASSAAQTGYVETTIKREDAGIFSQFMHDRVKEGDLIDVVGPSGVFTFRGNEAGSVVLIGGGVGITPLMAVIRYLADIAWPGEIFLVYGARSTEDFIFRAELEYLQSRRSNLHVAATMARTAGAAWMGAEGPITGELLTRSVPDLISRRVHLCGPPTMMEAVRKLLSDLGVPPEQVKAEAFGPALGAVPPPGVTQTIAVPTLDPRGLAAMEPDQDSIAGPATASIRFSKSNKVVPLAPDKSVLETAEAVGVAIDYSCRAGICGVCKTKLLEGSVTMEVDEALTPEDKAQNLILACQAKSIGNLVIEA